MPLKVFLQEKTDLKIGIYTFLIMKIEATDLKSFAGIMYFLKRNITTVVQRVFLLFVMVLRIERKIYICLFYIS